MSAAPAETAVSDDSTALENSNLSHTMLPPQADDDEQDEESLDEETTSEEDEEDSSFDEEESDSMSSCGKTSESLAGSSDSTATPKPKKKKRKKKGTSGVLTPIEELGPRPPPKVPTVAAQSNQGLWVAVKKEKLIEELAAGPSISASKKDEGAATKPDGENEATQQQTVAQEDEDNEQKLVMPHDHEVVHKAVLLQQKMGKPALWDDNRYQEGINLLQECMRRQRELFPQDHYEYAASIRASEIECELENAEISRKYDRRVEEEEDTKKQRKKKKKNADGGDGGPMTDKEKIAAAETPTSISSKIIADRSSEDAAFAAVVKHVAELKRKKQLVVPYGYSVLFEPCEEEQMVASEEYERLQAAEEGHDVQTSSPSDPADQENVEKVNDDAEEAAKNEKKRKIENTKAAVLKESDRILAQLASKRHVVPKFKVHRVKDGDPTQRGLIDTMNSYNEKYDALVSKQTPSFDVMAAIAAVSGSSKKDKKLAKVASKVKNAMALSPKGKQQSSPALKGSLFEGKDGEGINDSVKKLIENMRQNLLDDKHKRQAAEKKLQQEAEGRTPGTSVIDAPPMLSGSFGGLPPNTSIASVDGGGGGASFSLMSPGKGESLSASPQQRSGVTPTENIDTESNAAALHLQTQRNVVLYERMRLDKQGSIDNLLSGDKVEWKSEELQDDFMLILDETQEMIDRGEVLYFDEEAELAKKKAAEEKDKKNRTQISEVASLRAMGVAVPLTPAELQEKLVALQTSESAARETIENAEEPEAFSVSVQSEAEAREAVPKTAVLVEESKNEDGTTAAEDGDVNREDKTSEGPELPTNEEAEEVATKNKEGEAAPKKPKKSGKPPVASKKNTSSKRAADPPKKASRTPSQSGEKVPPPTTANTKSTTAGKKAPAPTPKKTKQQPKPSTPVTSKKPVSRTQSTLSGQNKAAAESKNNEEQAAAKQARREARRLRKKGVRFPKFDVVSTIAPKDDEELNERGAVVVEFIQPEDLFYKLSLDDQEDDDSDDETTSNDEGSGGDSDDDDEFQEYFFAPETPPTTPMDFDWAVVTNEENDEMSRQQSGELERVDSSSSLQKQLFSVSSVSSFSKKPFLAGSASFAAGTPTSLVRKKELALVKSSTIGDEVEDQQLQRRQELDFKKPVKFDGKNTIFFSPTVSDSSSPQAFNTQLTKQLQGLERQQHAEMMRKRLHTPAGTHSSSSLAREATNFARAQTPLSDVSASMTSFMTGSGEDIVDWRTVDKVTWQGAEEQRQREAERVHDKEKKKIQRDKELVRRLVKLSNALEAEPSPKNHTQEEATSSKDGGKPHSDVAFTPVDECEMVKSSGPYFEAMLPRPSTKQEKLAFAERGGAPPSQQLADLRRVPRDAHSKGSLTPVYSRGGSTAGNGPRTASTPLAQRPKHDGAPKLFACRTAPKLHDVSSRKERLLSPLRPASEDPDLLAPNTTSQTPPPMLTQSHASVTDSRFPSVGLKAGTPPPSLGTRMLINKGKRLSTPLGGERDNDDPSGGNITTPTTIMERPRAKTSMDNSMSARTFIPTTKSKSTRGSSSGVRTGGGSLPPAVSVAKQRITERVEAQRDVERTLQTAKWMSLRN